ncbi:hypothetical protein CHLNCDRAFT_140292 [Chlorella variabilis]|uniref:Uncharacterized protein n=3 Tax=Chlorella variabilis TaxID=554065 RepID=E1Z6P5_CHLVA|nr:hypothetical protein CHLNCDRAFT_140292 [Chlorella variabilis]EFN58685.1 hypothetical protein CHLNCDRAFT_140292 [Chlorella variabilis]|eukprot:XP_005850787.1 hypothetical protein CHLNCDRAFT_140292 [Chlorella variabilis]
MPDDLAAAFAALWRHSALPPLMQAGVMESAGVLRHYVLLHDAASQGPEVLVAAQEKLHQLGSTLGTSCQVLSINSGSGGGSPVGPRLWADMLHGCLPDGGGGEPAERPPVPPGGLGAWLSEADMSGLAGFVHELAVRSILPHMEMRLRALNVQVTANRKGLKNQLKSLLWRKGALDSASTPGTPSASGGAAGAAGVSYAGGSVESHMRQLSDLALMLGDYDTASSTLRLLASDTKADRAYKAYAGVQEALGAAAVLAGAPPSDAMASYKEALHRYAQLSQANPRNREGARYATRSVLLLAAYLQALGQYGEATAALMKAHFQEENLRAGLLLEQAAYCLLSHQPPHTRKFAFHLVLAGLRFDMCEQKQLSTRAYTQVLGVYSGRQWSLIEEHLHDALGRQAREGDDATGAVRHFMAMLVCPSNNLYCQQLYLTQFMDALRTAQAQLGFALPLELPLPEVNCERVTVAARWADLLQWRGGAAGGSRMRLAEAEENQRSCCVGEAVGLDVELHNPLQLDLHVTHLRLACTWDPATSSSGAGMLASGSSASRSPDGSLVPAPSEGGGQQQQPGFQVHEDNVTLQGGKRVIVHSRVVPLKPGSLHLHGLAWLLNGTAHGQAAFHIPRPISRKPGSSSKVLLDADRPAPGGMSFRVLPPMPRLEVSVTGLPAAVLAGEVVCCSMRLKNSGAMTLQHLSMAAAGTAGIFLGGGPAAGSGNGSDGIGSDGIGVAVYMLPNVRLGVGQELTLPVWFRFAALG